jgi:hypothetical protein
VGASEPQAGRRSGAAVARAAHSFLMGTPSELAEQVTSLPCNIRGGKPVVSLLF